MSLEELRVHSDSLLTGMRDKRMSGGWFQDWRELASFILPKRYRWLMSGVTAQTYRGASLNRNIIDSTGTLAARTLANGMFAGTTNPTRPWMKLKVENFDEDKEVAVWLSECEKRMYRVFQESNFYQAMATMFMDLVVFATAPVIIYEDFHDVINCFNPCCGEYMIELDSRLRPNIFAREFMMTHAQMVDQFGLDKVSDDVKLGTDNKTPGASSSSLQDKLICHLIEPNKGYNVLPERFKFREVYWDMGSSSDKILSVKGFYDWPLMCPRWDVTGNDPYGTGTAFDAIGDIKQLQHETRRKAQAIDKMVDPPMRADVQLKNNPAALIPGGVTYVSGLGTGRVGIEPIYTVMPPIGEMKQDIQEIQQRVKITFHNDLFTGITDLQTVRTATEIDARREEKLILLGPVLERITGQEGLGAAIDRVWGIMWRGRLLPPPPRQLGSVIDVQVDYISMLTLAQKGLATASIEKIWGFVGNLAAAVPQILDKMDADDTVDEYGDALGVSPRIIVSTDDANKTRQARQQQAAVSKLHRPRWPRCKGPRPFRRLMWAGARTPWPLSWEMRMSKWPEPALRRNSALYGVTSFYASRHLWQIQWDGPMFMISLVPVTSSSPPSLPTPSQWPSLRESATSVYRSPMTSSPPRPTTIS
jgi:hypothetical protein